MRDSYLIYESHAKVTSLISDSKLTFLHFSDCISVFKVYSGTLSCTNTNVIIICASGLLVYL